MQTRTRARLPTPVQACSRPSCIVAGALALGLLSLAFLPRIRTLGTEGSRLWLSVCWEGLPSPPVPWRSLEVTLTLGWGHWCIGCHRPGLGSLFQVQCTSRLWPGCKEVLPTPSQHHHLGQNRPRSGLRDTRWRQSLGRDFLPHKKVSSFLIHALDPGPQLEVGAPAALEGWGRTN